MKTPAMLLHSRNTDQCSGLRLYSLDIDLPKKNPEKNFLQLLQTYEHMVLLIHAASTLRFSENESVHQWTLIQMIFQL